MFFPCQDGWHVVGYAGYIRFARVAARLDDEHGTYVYRVGRTPKDAECRNTWCYAERGVPWSCILCAEAIDGYGYEPFAPSRRASFKKSLIEPFLSVVDPEGRLDKRTRKRRATRTMRAYYARLEHRDD
jgi:hypothetical protein